MEFITNLLGPVIENLDTIKAFLTAAGAVVLSSKAVTVITPTTVDDSIMGGLGKVINFGLKILNTLSLNVLKDKNADA